MADDFSILTVCAGNIHRSPLAAALLKTWVGWYLPQPLAGRVRVRSAGFAADVGAPMSSKVHAVAESLGADGSAHVATQITDELIEGSDLVLAASRLQRDEVLSRVPSALRMTFTMREAGRIASGMDPGTQPRVVRDLISTVAMMADHRVHPTGTDSDDVIDPQGRDLVAYAQMTREEVVPLARLAAILLAMPRPDVQSYLAAANDESALLAALADSESRFR